MSRILDDYDFFSPSRYQFVERSRHYPSVDIPFRRTLRCYRDVDDYLQPRTLTTNNSDKKINIDKNGFEVCIDVQQFKPEEISVKTEKNTILVHAKHEEKEDEQGSISRQFTRRYQLPKEFKPEDVFSTLSSDGILTVKCAAPNVGSAESRPVPIQQTGVQSNVDKKDGKETPVA